MSNYTFKDISNDVNSNGHFGNYCYVWNSLGSYPSSLFFSDFNGDQIEDIALLDVDILTGAYSYSHMFLSLNNIKFALGRKNLDPAFYFKTIAINDEFKYILHSKNFMIKGDFDGDGSTDLITLLFSLPSLQTKVKFISPKNDTEEEIINFSSEIFTESVDFKIINFNGNGKQDILFTYEDKIKIYELSQNSEGFVELIKLFETSLFNASSKLNFGDFNGDGKTDIYTGGSNIWYSTGIGLHKINYPNLYEQIVPPYIHLPLIISPFLKQTTMIADFNGDGRLDILNYYKPNCADAYLPLLEANIPNFENYYEKMHLFYFNGSDFTKITFPEEEEPTGELIVGDYNGDGSADLLGTGNSSICYFNKVSRNFNNELVCASPNYVTRIRDGFNNWVEYTYNRVTNTSIWPDSFGSLYLDFGGNISLTTPNMLLVTQIRRSNGIGSANNDGLEGYNGTEYIYEAGLYNKVSEKFIGFAKTTQENLGVSLKTSTIRNFNLEFQTLYVKGITKSTIHGQNNIDYAENEIEQALIGGSDISATIYGREFIPLGNKRLQVKLSQVHNYNLLKRTKKLTHNTINSDGNITETQTTVFDALHHNLYTENYTNTYTAAGDSAGLSCPYLLENVIKTTQVKSNPVYTTESHFTYYSQNGTLKSQEINGVTTHFENPDNFGNPQTIRVSVTDPNLQDRIETLTYDNTGRFITSKTNALNQTSRFEYNNVFNKISKTIDIKGHETKYQYDNWGRLKKTTYPNGIVSINTINWLASSTADLSDELYYTQNNTTDMPVVKSYFDVFGRKIRTETQSFGQKVLTKRSFNKYGRISEITDPYFEGNYSQALKTTFDKYDKFGRLEESTYNGHKTEKKYSLANSEYIETTSITVDGNKRDYKHHYDPLGNIVKSIDPYNTFVSTIIGSHGQPLSTNAIGASTSMTYNAKGLQTSLQDPNAGTTTYEYNAFGELTKQTNANHQSKKIVIDNYGRTDYTESPEGKTNITYVESGNGLGKVKMITAPNGNKITNTYDEFGNVIQETEKINNKYYTHKYTYDSYRKLTKERYPSNVELEYDYTDNGELVSVKIKDNNQTENNQTVWYCNSYNAKGQPNKVYLGSEGSTLASNYNYDALGRLTAISTASTFNMNYEWDDETGNLTSRSDGYNIENFSYDKLNRLKSWTVNGEVNTMYYKPNGNISKMPNVGYYQYNSTKVHALERVTQRSNAISTVTQDITYTSFSKAKTITEGKYQLRIGYGAGDYRKKTDLYFDKNGNGIFEKSEKIKTRIFAGNYEKEILEDGTIKEYHYISGPVGLIAVYIRENGDGQLYYTATDHLGSICQIIDTEGNLVEETNYDPWGRFRNDDWELDHTASLNTLFRGYTGHEHLLEFKIINMNGRMYDPVLGRMLSPDNYVQDPNNPQNYNRYAYCLNNPLIYTDPSGEFFWIPFVIGAVIGGYTGYKIADAKGYDLGDGQTWGYMLGGALIGGFSGALGAEIAAAGGFMANTSAMVFSSYSYSMGMSALSGGMIQPSVSFGFGSYNFGTGEFNYLLDGDNKWYEDLGYGLGAMANLADIGKTGNLLLNTEKKDVINHSAILDENGNRIISEGPGKNWIEPKGTIDHYLNRFLGGSGATNEYPIHGNNMIIKNVNITTIKNYGKVLDFLTQRGDGVLPYSFLYSSCSTHTGLALNLAGIPTLFIHPYTVQASVWLWNAGITPALINNSYRLQNW